MNKWVILILPILLGPILMSPVLADNEIILVIPPNDLTYVYGTSGHKITWMPESNSNGTYIVYINDSVIEIGAWQSNEIVNNNVDWLYVGFHIMNISIFNDYDEVNFTVEITVTEIATEVPTDIQAIDIIFMEIPKDFTYQINTIGNTIQWVAYTENPTYYSIHEVDTFQNGEWESLEPIVANVDGYGIGEHTITIVLYNGDSGETRESVTFEVINRIVPVVTPNDTPYESELIIDKFAVIVLVSTIIIVTITILIVKKKRKKFEIKEITAI